MEYSTVTSPVSTSPVSRAPSPQGLYNISKEEHDFSSLIYRERINSIIQSIEQTKSQIKERARAGVIGDKIDLNAEKKRLEVQIDRAFHQIELLNIEKSKSHPDVQIELFRIKNNYIKELSLLEGDLYKINSEIASIKKNNDDFSNKYSRERTEAGKKLCLSIIEQSATKLVALEEIRLNLEEKIKRKNSQITEISKKINPLVFIDVDLKIAEHSKTIDDCKKRIEEIDVKLKCLENTKKHFEEKESEFKIENAFYEEMAQQEIDKITSVYKNIIILPNHSMSKEVLLANLVSYANGELRLYRGIQQFNPRFPKDSQFRDLTPQVPGSDELPDFNYNKNSWLAMTAEHPTAQMVAKAWGASNKEYFRELGGIDPSKPIGVVLTILVGPTTPIAFCMEGEIQIRGPLVADPNPELVYLDDPAPEQAGVAPGTTFRDLAKSSGVEIKAQ